MKTNFNYFGITVVLGLMLTLYIGHASAENQSADFLVQTGIMELEKGNRQGAVHEFSKALMLEPENELAIKHLTELGFEEGIYADSPTAVGQQYKPNSGVEKYQEKISQLQRDKDMLNQQLSQLGADDNDRPRELLRQARLLEEEVIATKKPFHLVEIKNGPSLAEQIDEVNQVDTTDKKYYELARNLWHEREYDRDTSNSHFSHTEEVIDLSETTLDDMRNQARADSNLVDVIEVIDVVEGKDAGEVSDEAVISQAEPALPVKSIHATTSEAEVDDFSQAVDGYHDVQTPVNISASQELSFQLWINPDQERLIYDQFAYQDKLIHLLDDYLQVRESTLEDTKDELLATSLDLSQTELELLDQIKHAEDLNRVYGNLVKYVDDQPFLVGEENSYTEFMRQKLDLAQDQLIEQSGKIVEQEVYLASLEHQLEESRYRIDRLLDEREELLNNVVHEVSFMQYRTEAR